MNLTFETFLPLLPVGILGATTVVVMLAIAFLRHHWWNATITVVGLNLALASVIALVWQGTAPTAITPLLVVDNFAYFYMALILVAALACATLTHAFIDSYKNNREEMYLLLLIATAGALVLVCSRHMASFF
ncbi:MAG TPA: NADH-quinone oxidoreductase subunit N, partial [Agitococcus sp.]|nr:NADH-quinone oxidoreductase subunit N [Agitococcus sp.]